LDLLTWRVHVDHEAKAILTWLSPLEFPLQQSDFTTKRQKGTGQWFIESEKFKTWLSETGQILYSPGIPGSGKTMLTSIVIDHLTNTVQGKNIGTAYIYCNYKSRSDHTSVNLVASLLKQLLQARSTISEEVQSLYECHIRKNSHLTVDEVFSALQSEIGYYNRVNILIDALDECNDDDGTRQVLLSKLRVLQATNIVNLMVTSRFNLTIQQEFQSALQLEITASGQDVHMYLKGQMHRLPNFVAKKVGLQNEIISGIVETVDGMYATITRIREHLFNVSNLGSFSLSFI
jgi:hypothetical protein